MGIVEIGLGFIKPVALKVLLEVGKCFWYLFRRRGATGRYLEKAKENRLKQRKNENCLSLEGVYIDPPLVRTRTERYLVPVEEGGAKSLDSEEGCDTEEVQERITCKPILLEKLLSSDYKRVAIVAVSGMGKTTLLEELLLKIASNEIKTDLTPFYFHFRELPNPHTIIFLIKEKFNALGIESYLLNEYVENVFSQGQFLFLIDGLDQLPAGYDPESLLREGGHLGNNRIIFTSRPDAYNEMANSPALADFKLVEIKPFDDNKIKSFLGEKAYKDNILEQVRNLNPMLLQTPIFLAHIRDLVKEGKLKAGTIKTSSDVYKLVVSSLLEHTITVQRRYIEGGAIRDIETATILLSKLCYHTLRDGHLGYFPIESKDRLREALRISLTEFDSLTRLGVFSQIIEEPETHFYVFRHQSFQEYLASGELSGKLFIGNRLNEEVLLKHLEYRSCDDVFCFLAGREKLEEEKVKMLINAIAQYDLFLAAQCLSNFRGNRSNFKEIITQLLEGLSYADWYVRNPSAEALVQLDIKDKWVVDTILEKLRSGEWYERLSSAIVLWKLGIEDKDIVGVLLAELKSKDMFPRRPAAETLSALGIKEDRVIHALLLGLNDKVWFPRIWCAKALCKLGRKDTHIIQVLLEGLRSGEWFVRHAAAEALGQSGVKDDWVINTLLEGLDHADWYIRNPSAEALVQLNANDDWIIEKLLDKLRDGEWYVRISTADLLAKLGVKKDRAVETLLAEIKDGEWYARRPAVDALGQLRIKENRTIEALLATLKDKDKHTRSSSARALGQLRARENRVIDALLEAIRDECELVQASAAWSLGQVRAREDNVTVALQEGLGDEDSRVRSSSAEALGRLRVREERITEALLEKLRDEDSGVRGSSAKALGWIAGEMEKERDKRLETLEKRIKDGITTENDNDVRDGFGRALHEIGETTRRRFLRI
jgi:HEAT repeat protein